MRYREIGQDKLRVSAIGFGCQVFTGNYGAIPDDEAIEMVHRAIDLGVNFFDTSRSYGDGSNETVVGKALQGKRDDVVLCSKFGNYQYLRPTPERKFDSRPEHVIASCEASLKRLRTDHIDLYYQHRVDPDVPIEDTVGAMVRLKEQGKIRHLGLSESGPETLRRANAVHPITALESEYSIVARQYEADTIPCVREFAMGYVCYYPMARAFLAGAFRSSDGFSAEDVRHRVPHFSGDNMRQNLALLDQIGAIADEAGITLAQLALAWILHQGDFFIPIPGMLHREELEENVAAPDVELSEDLLHRIDTLFPRDGGMVGPLRRRSDLNFEGTPMPGKVESD